MCLNVFEYVRMYFKYILNVFECVRTCSNVFECVGTCSNVFECISNVFECV